MFRLVEYFRQIAFVECLNFTTAFGHGSHQLFVYAGHR